MSWGHYLFSFHGRINRAKSWLFLLIVFVIEIVAIAVVVSAFGVSHITDVLQNKAQPTVLTSNSTAIATCGIVGLVFLLVIYAGFAVAVKRLHDRNKSAWWLFIFFFLPQLLNTYRIDTLWTSLQHRGTLQNNDPMSIIAGGIASIISLWAFVELYCLRGTVGGNRYGSDPLAGRT